MKVVSRVETLRSMMAALRNAQRVGFVPTMGAFHRGHLSLMRQARKECDIVVVSIFVNPTQFGPLEDYATYPRSLSSDKTAAQKSGVDILWVPTVAHLYPEGYRTRLSVGPIGALWEGERRPGHFDGVATIVAILLSVLRPHTAYFGQKDYQQVCVIRQIIRDLHFDMTLRILSTLRETDGLAMSSRNIRLPPHARRMAPALYEALQGARLAVRQGKRLGRTITEKVIRHLHLAGITEIDYVALCHPETLEPLRRLDRHAVLLAAVRLGTVRLIDNILLSAR